MATVAALIEQTRQRLSPGRRDAIDKLAETVNDSATALSLTYTNVLATGQRLSVDLEDFHVWEGSGTSASVVQRAMNGSTADDHTAGALVYIEPTFSAFEIVRAFNETLAALPGWGVYRFRPVTLTSSGGRTGYNLTNVTDILAGHRLRWSVNDGSDNWRVVPRSAWKIEQQMPTADFAAGEALFVYEDIDPGVDLQLLYRAPFTALATTGDVLDNEVETDTGLSAALQPLLVVGAALRLTQGRPLERSDTTAQGDTRRPREVTTADTRLATDPLQIEWQTLIRGAKREQVRRYGP